MENTITLNSGQKVEVLLQDEVSLDIDCALRYIKSGEQEINSYVKNTAQPHLDNVITQAQTAMANQIAAGIENASKAATAAAAQEINNAKEEIDNYTQQHIISELNGILSDAENASAAASAKAQEAAAEAEAAAGSAAGAQTKAAAASASADLAETWAEQTKEAARKLSNGLNLFDVKWSDHLLESISWLRADTFSWQSGAVYTAAYNELLSEYNNETSVEETENDITFKRTPKGYKIAAVGQEETVLDLYNTTGVAWYYILDTENQRFKLPRTKWGFIGFRNHAGDYISESLPNIKGITVGNRGNCNEGEPGPFYNDESTHNNYGNNVAAVVNNLGFDASRSSSAYQNNAPVQQRATEMHLYFYVGNYDNPAIEQTAGLNTELFNGKLDIDIGNITVSTKNKIIGWEIPDYSARITVSAGEFTPPVDGVLIGWTATKAAGIDVSFNGEYIQRAYTNSQWETYSPLTLPVAKGETYVIANNKNSTLNFYPCKGAN